MHNHLAPPGQNAEGLMGEQEDRQGGRSGGSRYSRPFQVSIGSWVEAETAHIAVAVEGAADSYIAAGEVAGRRSQAGERVDGLELDIHCRMVVERNNCPGIAAAAVRRSGRRCCNPDIPTCQGRIWREGIRAMKTEERLACRGDDAESVRRGVVLLLSSGNSS